MVKNVSRARVKTTILVWVGLSLLEIVLVGKFDAQETPAGIAIALFATLLTVRALHVSAVHYRFRPAWLFVPLLVARNVVRDTFVVYGVLFRRLAGGRVDDAFLDVAFDPGGDDPESAARRALAIAGVSTSPNEIVLAVDARNRTMRVHTMAVTASPRHSDAWPL